MGGGKHMSDRSFQYPDPVSKAFTLRRDWPLPNISVSQFAGMQALLQRSRFGVPCDLIGDALKTCVTNRAAAANGMLKYDGSNGRMGSPFVGSERW